MLAAIRKGRELMATSPLKEIDRRGDRARRHLKTDDEMLDWVRNNAETTYHPVGTCKMGSDPMAVVDPSSGCTASGPAGRRRLDHADPDQRQHQRALHHDRREVRGDGAGGGGAGAGGSLGRGRAAARSDQDNLQVSLCVQSVQWTVQPGGWG